MINPQEATIDLKKYLRKLLTIIEREAQFTLIKSKIFNKKRIDDALCCIDASWPEDYKSYITKYRSTRLNSPAIYKKLILAIKNKFFLSSDCYSVQYEDTIKAIKALMVSIDKDMNFIYSEESGMF